MNKVPQSKEDLEGHLSEQICFLQAISKLYDSGHQSTAKHLAVALRVLLYDHPPNSVSLFGQLGIKGILFLDTSPDYIPARRFVSHYGLVTAQFSFGPNSEARFIPKCSIPPPPNYQEKMLAFEKWWSKVVLVDNKGHEFSRRDIVLALSDKLGGAHVDPLIPEQFSRLIKRNSMGLEMKIQGAVIPVSDVELASGRQISHEVIETIKRSSLKYIP
jgi:hypothetical protein